MTNTLGIYTPTTLANMIADLSIFLADQYDGTDVISAQEWDEVHRHMMTLIGILDSIVGTETMDRLMDAGADPEAIYELA